jgi:hypothetical protein
MSKMHKFPSLRKPVSAILASMMLYLGMARFKLYGSTHKRPERYSPEIVEFIKNFTFASQQYQDKNQGMLEGFTLAPMSHQYQEKEQDEYQDEKQDEKQYKNQQPNLE